MRRAVTLIELLVVIGIAAVLIGLLLSRGAKGSDRGAHHSEQEPTQADFVGHGAAVTPAGGEVFDLDH